MRLFLFLLICMPLSILAQFEAFEVIADGPMGFQNNSFADLDGDGDLDCLWFDSTSLRIFANNGTLPLVQTGVISERPGQFRNTDVGDGDGDGILDIVGGFASSQEPFYIDTLFYYKNTGVGYEPVEVLADTSYFNYVSALWEDYNNDGHLDIIAVVRANEPGPPYYALTLENDGAGNFDLVGEDFIGYLQGQIRIERIDLNLDGFPDIVAHGNLSNVRIHLAESETSYSDSYSTIGTGIGLASHQFIDVNLDGNIDLVNGSFFDSPVWLENTGNGDFPGATEHEIDNPQWGSSFAVLTQISSDNYADAVVFRTEEGLFWKESFGGSFTDQAYLISPDLNFGLMSVLDFDQDGRDDLIFKTSTSIGWMRNIGFAGCTDESACNYSEAALEDDGSCCYDNCGCTNPNGFNYDPANTCDDGSCTFEISGTFFNDENGDGFQNIGEQGLANQSVTLMPGNVLGLTDGFGKFSFEVDPGAYTISAELPENFPFWTTSSTSSASIYSVASSNHNFGASIDFPIVGLQSDVNQWFWGLCNGPGDAYISANNTSNVPIDVSGTISIDPLIEEFFVLFDADSIVGNSVYWSEDALAAGGSLWQHIFYTTPSPDFLGEWVHLESTTEASINGEVVATSFSQDSTEVTCAYDPNDKQVFPNGYSEAHYVPENEELEYLIRFQNTGNAPAINVHILDSISEFLDLESIEPIGQSHNMSTTVDFENRVVDFYFPEIMLPDSTTNEPESHGFVRFKIRPAENIPLLSEINNTADIYFDNNEPIITNTTWSTTYNCSLFDVNFTQDGATLSASEGDHYQWYFNGNPIQGATEQTLQVEQDGSYAVEISSNFPCNGLSSSIFIVGIEEWDSNASLQLFPNPMTDHAILDLGEGFKTVESILLFDSNGRLIRSLTADSREVWIAREGLAAGNYSLQILQDGGQSSLKFVVK